MSESWTAWAVVHPNGTYLLADTNFRNEDHAWKIFLGWPDDEEIERAKKSGYRAMQVLITPLEQEKP